MKKATKKEFSLGGLFRRILVGIKQMVPGARI